MAQFTESDLGHLRAAGELLARGETRRALAELDQLGIEHRARPEVLRLRVRAHALAREWNHLMIVAGALARMYPDQAFGVVHYSDALRHLGRFDEAIDFLLPIAQQHPGEPWPAYHLACALCRTGDLNAARRWLEHAFQRAAITEDLRGLALLEEDLKPLWKSAAA